jgi:hypothetical protein
MAASSFWMYVRKMPADAAANGSALSETYPVSAARAFDVRSNLLHLMDEFTQMRINWCAGKLESGTGGNGVMFAENVGGAYYEQEFPLTWLAPDHPANLDILVRSYASGTDAEMDVRVRVVSANAAVGDLGAPAVFDESQTVNSTFGTLDELCIFDTSDTATMNVLRSSFVAVPNSAGVEEDSEVHYPQECMLKIQVQLLPTNGSGTLYFLLTGVMVREFA